MFLEITREGAISRLPYPLVAGSGSKTWQRHLETRASCKRLGPRPERSIKPCLSSLTFSR